MIFLALECLLPQAVTRAQSREMTHKSNRATLKGLFVAHKLTGWEIQQISNGVLLQSCFALHWTNHGACEPKCFYLLVVHFNTFCVLCMAKSNKQKTWNVEQETKKLAKLQNQFTLLTVVCSSWIWIRFFWKHLVLTCQQKLHLETTVVAGYCNWIYILNYLSNSLGPSEEYPQVTNSQSSPVSNSAPVVLSAWEGYRKGYLRIRQKAFPKPRWPLLVGNNSSGLHIDLSIISQITELHAQSKACFECFNFWFCTSAQTQDCLSQFLIFSHPI